MKKGISKNAKKCPFLTQNEDEEDATQKKKLPDLINEKFGEIEAENVELIPENISDRVRKKQIFSTLFLENFLYLTKFSNNSSAFWNFFKF